MKVYEIIYDFIKSEIFVSTQLESIDFTIGSETLSMTEWLSHTTTIILMGLFIFLLILLAKWLFKIVSNLFLLR